MSVLLVEHEAYFQHPSHNPFPKKANLSSYYGYLTLPIDYRACPPLMGQTSIVFFLICILIYTYGILATESIKEL